MRILRSLEGEKKIVDESRFLEAPFVRMLRMRSASLKIETIFAKYFARNYEKKVILGASDAWLMSCLSHRPSNPAYYIEDWRIFEVCSFSSYANFASHFFPGPRISIFITGSLFIYESPYACALLMQNLICNNLQLSNTL